MAQRKPHTLAPARCRVCGMARQGAHNGVHMCATCNAVAIATAHTGTVPTAGPPTVATLRRGQRWPLAMLRRRVAAGRR